MQEQVTTQGLLRNTAVFQSAYFIGPYTHRRTQPSSISMWAELLLYADLFVKCKV